MTYRLKKCIKCGTPFVLHGTFITTKEELCELHRRVPDEMFTHDGRRGYIHVSCLAMVK